MKLNELNDIISEMVQEEIFKTKLKTIISEELHHHLNEKKKKSTKKESDDENINIKRKAIKKALKDPKYNHAQLAYKLYKPKDKKEKDTVRSLFSKKVTGHPDNDGNVRSFTEDEVNKIHQMLRKN